MTEFTTEDERFMRRAHELAAGGLGMTSPNPMVGAVLVKDGRIIGEGWHRGTGLPHAEIEAFNACKEDPAGATMYVNLEPCAHHGRTPPCAPVLVEKKIRRLVASQSDPHSLVKGKGFALLRKAGIQVDVGLLEKEASRLNQSFLTRHTLNRPFMISKWAMTLDGRIASESGHSKWISNEQSRHYVHEIRSHVDAVLVGIGTVLLDNPFLNVRLENYKGRQPRRIIADDNLRIPLKSKCLERSEAGQCIIATTRSAQPEKVQQLTDAGHRVLVLPGRAGLINLNELLVSLAELDIQSVLCEGGSSIHGSMFQAKFVDKIIAFIAPKIVGGNTLKSPVSGWGVPLMSSALQLEEISIRHFGDDVCVEGYIPDSHRRTKPLYHRKHADETPEDE